MSTSTIIEIASKEVAMCFGDYSVNFKDDYMGDVTIEAATYGNVINAVEGCVNAKMRGAHPTQHGQAVRNEVTIHDEHTREQR